MLTAPSFPKVLLNSDFLNVAVVVVLVQDDLDQQFVDNRRRKHTQGHARHVALAPIHLPVVAIAVDHYTHILAV